MRRVFRDYLALIMAREASHDLYRQWITPLGLGRVEISSDDKKAIQLMEKIKPNLVVAARKLEVFSGMQLLSAARQDERFEQTPFLIIGDKEDMRAGGVAEQVAKAGNARLIPIPQSADQFVQAALELLDPLINQEQEKAYQFFDEGAELFKNGDFQGSSTKYEEGLKLYGRKTAAWLEYARAQTKLNLLDSAEGAYLSAIQSDNFSLQAYFGMADLYERRGDFEQCISILKQALSIAKMVKNLSKSESRINFFIGEFELRLKRLTEAAQAFDEAIKADPNNPGLRAAIGDAYADKGFHAESEKHYEAALKMDPSVVHVLNRLGIAYRRQGKFDKALELYQDARVHHPDDHHLMFNIARTHYEANQYPQAEEMLREALAVEPEFKEAKAMLRLIRSATNRVELDVTEKPSSENEAPA